MSNILIQSTGRKAARYLNNHATAAMREICIYECVCVCDKEMYKNCYSKVQGNLNYHSCLVLYFSF